eukprot:CAMPEP_0113968208 /NCGR_PEP_ID=MMETSP0011_2-20120614/9387_1 /TAXON_ID=101924 /ORGANISM="Rhodosorus marinus" /LENGTH=93 /DNA_ID=CAMNT_0000981235 /DNA_START=815 /DNA_END=1096 /DNA_ORIENTATION=- /assembly_acc=CAM_ASM_000156
MTPPKVVGTLNRLRLKEKAGATVSRMWTRRQFPARLQDFSSVFGKVWVTSSKIAINSDRPGAGGVTNVNGESPRSVQWRWQQGGDYIPYWRFG